MAFSIIMVSTAENGKRKDTKMDVKIVRDGLSLAARYEYVADPIVILSHGFMADMGYKEDSNYKVLEKQLNDNGFSTIRFDFNGNGKSDGEQANMTVFNEISDLMAVFKFAKEKGHKDVYLLGHSQGGVVTAMTAGLYHDLVKGIVLMSSAVALKYDALSGCTMGKKYDPEAIPSELDLYGMYHLGGDYLRIAQNLPIYEVAGKYEGPVCLIHGLEDEVVAYQYSVELDKIYKNSELHLIEGENHNLKNHRQQCFDIAIDFLNKLK